MNIQNLMKQAQKMQSDMNKKQIEINNTVFPGKYSLVELEMLGNRKLIKLSLKNNYNVDPEDWEILEDAILMAVNQTLSEIEKENENLLANLPKVPGLF